MEVSTQQAGGICTITLNRPDKKNALTAAMYLALSDALKAAEEEGTVRVVLLQGQSDYFTAGNDIADFLQHPPEGRDSPVFRFMQALSSAEKPVIASVAGPAVGIGTTMLLHCDLVYAADTARFSLPFAQLGLCPEFGASLLLPRIAGYPRAAEKLLLGEAFDTQEALAMGLLSRVVPAPQLHDFTVNQATKLANLPPSALRVTKRLMKQGWTASLERQMREESRDFRGLLSQPHAQEALTAFLEKRKPDFTPLS